MGEGGSGPFGWRVQSVAVKLIVEREREIRAFVPEEYWELFVDLSEVQEDADAVRFQVVKVQDQSYRPKSRSDIDITLTQIA